MKICIAGKNDIAVSALNYLIDDLKIPKNDICVVCNKTENGIDGWQKSLYKAAIDKGIFVAALSQVYEIKDLLFLSLEFDQIVNPKKFQTRKLYNIHFSNLPSYKGMYTSVMPLINGENMCGVTLHKIDDGIDTGDIIAQKLFAIENDCTAKELYLMYVKHGTELFRENMVKLISDQFSCKPQDCFKSSYYAKSSVDFKNIVIDLKKTSFQIHNQLRAFIFDVYQLPQINGKYICSTHLTNEFIGRNQFIEKENMFIISGIDGYKIEAKVIDRFVGV